MLPFLSSANIKGNFFSGSDLTQDTVIDATLEKPYEIHLVSFPSEAEFESFTQDKERKQFLHLKEQSIREVWLIQGHKL
jgi:hypothetical protein